MTMRTVRDLVADMHRWRDLGHAVALARVVEVEGSAPRGPGAAMAVNDAGEVRGSVSGGCVESAVHADALAVIASGVPRKSTYGISDDEAFGVGLTCGGTIHLFVEPVDARCAEALAVVEHRGFEQSAGHDEHTAFAWVTELVGPSPGATLVAGPGRHRAGTLGDERLDLVVVREAAAELAAGRSCIRHFGIHGESRRREVEVFVHAFVEPPRMIIFGAVDFTTALARVASLLGFRVSVVDAREVFATSERFPMAHEVIAEWPDRYLMSAGANLGPRDAVCVLTHDHRFDVPAIEAALRTQVGYLGAMGSRRTHIERVERLREAGIDEAGLARVMSPIGLDLGATTPEETAVSICAEIIARRNGRSVPSLRDTTGPIHEQSSTNRTAELSPPSPVTSFSG